jgi:hypothetical protein
VDIYRSVVPDDVEISSPPMAVLVVQPRHPHVPEVSPDGRIFFESLYFVYSIMCLCWQYVHMYKTVWWLPQSHSHYALVSLLKRIFAIFVNNSHYLIISHTHTYSVVVYHYRIFISLTLILPPS